MNKKKYIILALIIFFVIGGIAVFWNRKNRSELQSSPITISNEKPAKDLPQLEKDLPQLERDEEQETTYVEHQVLCSAESEKEAKKIADKIGGTLVSYLEGMGIISIEETVQELMDRLAAEGMGDLNIYPNYIYSINEIGIN